MAFCGNCGKEVKDGIKFCPECGATMPAPKAAEQTAPAAEDLTDKVKNLNNTADTTSEFDPKDIEKNKLMSILAYCSWLVLIPMFAAKDSKYTRFHVNQGIVLAIAEIAWWILQFVLVFLLALILPKLGFLRDIVGFVGWLLNIAFLIEAVLGILNAVGGKAKELPLIGKFKILK